MSRKHPLVSVILPSYNGSKYIEGAIESILNQSLQDWELILVDDCSDDNTLSIMKKYSELDDRIIVIHNKQNFKLPGALNVGVLNARGKFISWTSDDNLYDCDALKIMATALLSEPNNTAMVTCRYRIWNVNNDGDVVSELISDTYKEEDFYTHNIVGACFMYRSEIVEKIGMYDTSVFCAEDYEYWLRIYSKAGKIKFIDRVLYTYRQHPGNLSATKKKEIFIQTYRVLEKYCDRWLEIYKDKPDKLMCLYYMSVMSNTDETKRIRSVIKEKLPVLNAESYDFSNYERYMVWGCGDLGRKTARVLRDKVAFFVDSDSNKVGSVMDGIDVKGVDSIRNYQSIPIIIAVKTESIYEIINQINMLGVNSFFTIWGLISVGKMINFLW